MTAIRFGKLARTALITLGCALVSACDGGARIGGPVPALASPALPSPGGVAPAPGGGAASGSPVGGASPGAPGASPTGDRGSGASPSPAASQPAPAGTQPPPAGTQPSPTGSGAATPPSVAPPPAAGATPPALNANGTVALHHIWLIILENQAEDNTFGATMPVPYLSQTMVAQGALVPNYWGTSHASLGNYISLMSGQSVTVTNQADCAAYSSIVQTSSGPYGQVGGTGCVYPAATLSFFNQLESAKLGYRGYMEDMGNNPAREASTCGQTQPIGAAGAATGTGGMPTGSADITEAASPTDQYAMRHNPFDYFAAFTETALCTKNVVPLTMATLKSDVASIATTPNFSFITPNLCDDGHDVPCTAAGAAGTTASTQDNENAFLREYVPLITRSPAFRQDGLLIVTFDESSPTHDAATGTDTTSDASSCCMEPLETMMNTAANTQTPGYEGTGTPSAGSATTAGQPNDGSGGGRTGTVLVSPYIVPGTVTGASYNHYATLHTLEDEFGLGYLGLAGYPGTRPFGTDVFGTTKHAIAL